MASSSRIPPNADRVVPARQAKQQSDDRDHEADQDRALALTAGKWAIIGCLEMNGEER
jgi:hypothetical protein